jgi:hypothetical protein
MSFDRVKPFAEAITGAHMGRTPSWARLLEVLRDVNTRFSRRGPSFRGGGARFGKAL